jgi:hypothetical protein
MKTGSQFHRGGNSPTSFCRNLDGPPPVCTEIWYIDRLRPSFTCNFGFRRLATSPLNPFQCLKSICNRQTRNEPVKKNLVSFTSLYNYILNQRKHFTLWNIFNLTATSRNFSLSDVIRLQSEERGDTQSHDSRIHCFTDAWSEINHCRFAPISIEGIEGLIFYFV